MRTTLFILMIGLSGVASGTTYYVSSSSGSDSNNGTSSGTAWQTMAKVNAQTFLPGDSILLNRGNVWNESLVPPTSGASGNPITFDAYGIGAAPNLTGYYAVPSSAWVQVTGNAWKSAVPAGYTTINFCLFGSVWGQKVGAVSSNLTAQWDFYLANGFVYVYSVGNPSIYYPGPIVPMALSNVPVIDVNGKSWLTFQHLLVNWFDQYGVYVQGASDHLVFANMEMDSMIPQGTQPLGLYVNESTPGPGDIKIYNAEAHMNYDGFRFDGTATAITMVNDKAYANRDGALVDNTGAVTYSYCHFYASSLAVAGSTDVLWTSGSGPTAGAGNIAADVAPAVQAWKRYPAEVTLTVDDAGMTPGADTYYGNTVLPIADAAGVPVGAAITVGFTATIAPIVSEIQGWINAGRDVTSHSMSHTYYTNTDALDIQYTGSGTAATLSISGKVLAITVTGAADGVSYNLAKGQPQGTILGLEQALTATGHFTATENPICQGPYGTGCSAYTKAALLAQDLADVSSQNVKSAVYAMQLDVTRLTTDEITLSRQWMTSNLTGLPATPVYVYPGGYETTTMQGITASVPYIGARGALKEDLGVKDTYATGFDFQNVTSFGVNPSWQGLLPASLNQKIQALVWKQMVWGVPWGVFWHLNELTESDPVGGTEITNLVQDFKASGATIQTNTGLVNWLATGTLEAGTDGNFYYKSPASSMLLDFRPTAGSPVVDAGQNLGTAYQIDINGLNQNSFGNGWEIGAHAFVAYSGYGGANPPTGTYFTIGVAPIGGQVQLPEGWVNSNESTSTTANTITFPATGTGGSWTCGATNYGPYTAGSGASLQQAVNDIEACRTATSVGATLNIPPGTYTATTNSGLVIPQTASGLSSNFLILRSTQDSSLPPGTTVCAHGIQDNLPTSSDIGLFNPDCTGTNMYYTLGPILSGGVISGITTLSTSTTTLTAIGTTGMQCVALANGYVAPGVAEVVDSGSNQETVTTTSGVNQTGMCGNFTKTHASRVAVIYNVGAFTLANGSATNTSAYHDASHMWTIQAQATGNSTALSFCFASATTQTPVCAQNLGPDHWIIQDMEARLFAGNLGTGFVAQVGAVTAATTQAQLATHIHFQRDWFHGDWTSTLTGANAISGGLDLECVYCSLMDSQVSEILSPGSESHPATVQGDQVKLGHNWTDGGSEGFFSGGFSGGSGPSIFGWIPFCDAEVRRNRFSYPFSWLGQSPILGGANPNYATNFSLVRKNAQENKDGCRVVISGNIFENVDNSGAQDGVMIGINPRNNSFGAGDYYLSTVNNVTVQNNVFRNGCAAVDLTTSEVNEGFGIAYPPRDIAISNNLFYNIGITNYGCSSFAGLQSDSGGGSWQGTITQADATHETFVAECSVDLDGCIGQVNGVTITGGTCGGSPTLSFSTPNIAGGNLPKATVRCSGTAFTSPVLSQYGSGYTSAPTVTLTCSGCSGSPVPAATINSSSSGISTAVGFQAFDVSVGDPVAIDMCQTSSFNTVGTTLNGGSYVPSAIGPAATTGSTAWAGSFVAGNVTVSTTHTGTALSTETSHYCKFTTLQGAPYGLRWNHNTLVSNSTHAINSSNAFNNTDNDGPNFQLDAAMQNSLFTAGDWGSSSVGSGTVAQEFNYDAANTLTADHLVFAGQTTSNYTAFGLNPYFPVTSPVMYFPATAYCSTASATASCIGFAGAMSASSMPLTLPDYHQFALVAGSSFKASGADQASDGTDMGVAISSLDRAQTQKFFVCTSACGAPGPYPDAATPLSASPMFGFSETNTSSSNFPNVSYGVQRIWDSPPLQWPSLNTAVGVFSFTNLDTLLAQDYANGVAEVMYTLARTPPWITSQPTDTTCNYQLPAVGGGNGECFAPNDVNANGSGTDATWKAWVTAIATHVNDPTYLQTHAHIVYWEIWNEPDATGYWSGSIAQLARLTEDANCIITGRGPIHQSGDGTGTACTATAIDPAAKIIMSAAHASSTAQLTYGQNELYCNNSPSGLQLPCPNPGNAIAAAVDVVNFHLKPGNEIGNNCPAGTACTVESAMAWYVSSIQGILQPAELAKPLWNGEASYATFGFTGAYADVDMAASFMPRLYLTMWSLGISGSAFYTWDALKAEPAEVQSSYQQAYNWLEGSVLTLPCSATGTVWSCGINKSGTSYQIMWDDSQSCSGGSCTTANQPVGTQWGHYQDMTSSSSPSAILANNVAVGIKPVVLSQ